MKLITVILMFATGITDGELEMSEVYDDEKLYSMSDCRTPVPPRLGEGKQRSGVRDVIALAALLCRDLRLESARGWQISAPPRPNAYGMARTVEGANERTAEARHSFVAHDEGRHYDYTTCAIARAVAPDNGTDTGPDAYTDTSQDTSRDTDSDTEADTTRDTGPDTMPDTDTKSDTDAEWDADTRPDASAVTDDHDTVCSSSVTTYYGEDGNHAEGNAKAST